MYLLPSIGWEGSFSLGGSETDLEAIVFPMHDDAGASGVALALDLSDVGVVSEDGSHTGECTIPLGSSAEAGVLVGLATVRLMGSLDPREVPEDPFDVVVSDSEVRAEAVDHSFTVCHVFIPFL